MEPSAHTWARNVLGCYPHTARVYLATLPLRARQVPTMSRKSVEQRPLVHTGRHGAPPNHRPGACLRGSGPTACLEKQIIKKITCNFFVMESGLETCFDRYREEQANDATCIGIHSEAMENTHGLCYILNHNHTNKNKCKKGEGRG